MRHRFIKAFHLFLREGSATILNKQLNTQPPVLVRGFHNQQLVKDAHSLGNQITTPSLRSIVKRIQHLYGSRQENDIWSLLDSVDLQKVLLADNERLVGLLGRLSLESDAKKLMLKLQTIDEDYKHNMSNFIRLYTMSLSKKPDFVVRKLRLLHRELNVPTTPDTYNNMIEMCLDRKEASLAVDIVGFMLEDGLNVDTDVLNRILETSHYVCDFSLVRTVHTMICDGGIKPNEITIERMIHLFMKMNEPIEAKRLLREVRRFDVDPTTDMYNLILGGYFEKKERKRGWEFLSQMDRRNIKRNAGTYRCILSGCERENEITKYNLEMQREGIRPTIANYEALIKSYAYCRSFNKAKEVLLDLDKTMPPKDLNELRNTLVSTLAIYDQTDDAFQAYEEIRNANHPVKPQTTKMLIQHTREVHRLLAILNDLESYGDWDYNCVAVILQCVEDKFITHATNLVSNRVRRWPVRRRWMMENMFDEVFHRILNTLLKNPKDAKTLVFGLALFSEIRGIIGGLGANSSRRTHDFVLYSCYLQRKIGFLLHVWKIYPQSRLPYCILNYLSMYKALMVCGQSSIAQTIVQHISGNDIDEHVHLIRNACDKGV